MNATTDHLGLPRFERVPPLKNWHAGADLIPGTPPTAADLSGLAELYSADLTVFEQLSGLDTSAWSTRQILDGRLDPAELAARFATKVAPASMVEGFGLREAAGRGVRGARRSRACARRTSTPR